MFKNIFNRNKEKKNKFHKENSINDDMDISSDAVLNNLSIQGNSLYIKDTT